MTCKCLTQVSCSYSCNFTLFIRTSAYQGSLQHFMEPGRTSTSWEGLREDVEGAELGHSSCIICYHGQVAHSWNLGKFRWFFGNLRISLVFSGKFFAEKENNYTHPQDSQGWVQCIIVAYVHPYHAQIISGLIQTGLRVSVSEEAGSSFLNGVSSFSLFFKIMGSGLPLVETSLCNMFPQNGLFDNKGWQHLMFSPDERFISVFNLEGTVEGYGALISVPEDLT